MPSHGFQKFALAILFVAPLFSRSVAWADPDQGKSTPVLADKGGDSSSGGDTPSIRWINSSKKLSQLLRAMAEKGNIDLHEIDFDRLDTAIKDAKVSFTHDPIFVMENGRKVEKEARCIRKNKPPLIEFNIDKLDAVPSMARRAALQIHEYINAMNGDREPGDPGYIDDSNFQVSSRIESHPTIVYYTQELDEFQPSGEGRDPQVTVNCKLYDHGKWIPGALGRIGSGGVIDGIGYDAALHLSRKVRTTDQGMLMVSVDTLSETVLKHLNQYETKVKGPVIRISVGYGDNFMGPPLKVISQTDVRAVGHVDSSVEVPVEGITVTCKKVTKEDLIEDRKRFMPIDCDSTTGKKKVFPLDGRFQEDLKGVLETLGNPKK